MSRVTNAQLLEAINNMSNTIASIDARVSALEKSSEKTSKVSATSKKTSKKSSKTAPKAKTSGKKSSEDKVVDLEKFEPKTDVEGFYIWASYKAMRSAYCYNKLGCKTWRGKVTKPEGFVFDREAWDSAKAEFAERFIYVKREEREAL